MFNVFLLWNPGYIKEIFKSSLFDIINYKHKNLDDANYNSKHYILKIKYTSKIGLSINPVIVKHPRYKSPCMALFFTNDNNNNELIIDTRTTDYCDFVDYIQPHINNIDLIQRQEKYWQWLQYFNQYVVDFSMKETENNYIISLTHGMDVIITFENNQFTVNKLNLRYMELMAYVKSYKIPKLENIIVNYL
jgi:hypothetical protein